MSDVEKIKRMLQDCTADERREVLEYLRVEFPIHPIEARFNVKAEVILEAIARASDLTLRGVRGVIAEAAFDSSVVGALQGWESLPVAAILRTTFCSRMGLGRSECRSECRSKCSDSRIMRP